jgi:hypothetical protein
LNSSEVKEVLIQAREKIARPGGWTRGCSARDIAGRSVLTTDPDARSWCAVGAIMGAARENGSDWQDAFNQIHRLAVTDNPSLTVTGWNDRSGRTQDEVVALFDRAIASC